MTINSARSLLLFIGIATIFHVEFSSTFQIRVIANTKKSYSKYDHHSGPFFSFNSFPLSSSAIGVSKTVHIETNNADLDSKTEDSELQHKSLPIIKKRFWITGISPPRETSLNEAVSRMANVSLDGANELVSIGAVWAKMDTLTEDDLLAQYENDEEELYADLPKGWGNGNFEKRGDNNDLNIDDYITQMESQRFRRILTPTLIQPGTDLRIYPNPRRFPACYNIDLKNLLYQDTTFIVIDKPAMLPTQPDASNYDENCPGCVQDILGPFQDIKGNTIRRPLICHRVDSVVGGCVVMSKDRNGQRVFQELQRQRKLKKLYLAVTTKPVPIGMHLHWMWAPQSKRGNAGGPHCQLISHFPPESRRKARQFWTRCMLEVTKCEPIALEKTEDGYDPGLNQHYQSTIRLVTGRKHQVRAQLSSLGCPIIRDTLYEPMSGISLGDIEMEEDIMEEAIAQCRVPTKPIGLQAHAILFGGIKARAPKPWWGDNIN